MLTTGEELDWLHFPVKKDKVEFSSLVTIFFVIEGEKRVISRFFKDGNNAPLFYFISRLHTHTLIRRGRGAVLDLKAWKLLYSYSSLLSQVRMSLSASFTLLKHFSADLYYLLNKQAPV